MLTLFVGLCQGFPTIVKLRGDKYVDYSGDRSAEALVAWAKEEPAAADWRSVAAAPPAKKTSEKAATISVEPGSDSDVLALLDSTFGAHLAEHKATPTIVDFYATWCGHCQKLAPIYASAATTSKRRGQPVLWAKVDIDQAQDVSERFNIEGLPTIVAIRGDSYWTYEGSRKASDLVAWAEGEEWTAATARKVRTSHAYRHPLICLAGAQTGRRHRKHGR